MTDISLSDVRRASDEILDAIEDRDALRLSWDVERELARRDTYYLAKYVLGYDKLNDSFHRALASFYDKHLYEPQINLHPRGHYKTTILTIAGSIRLALLDPDISILIRMNAERNARKVVMELKRHFSDNEKFRALFPEHATKTRRQEGSGIAFTTPARVKKWIRSPTFEAGALGQRLTSNHYIHVKFDDIVDEDNCTTSELRMKTREDYTKTLSLCDGQTPTGLPWHHITGTRWHMDDAYHHLLERNKDSKTFKVLITSAYYQKKDPMTGGEKTKILFPEEFSWERLQFIKEDYDRQGSNLFQCLYLNDPVPGDDVAMDARFLKWYAEDDPEFKKKRLSTMILTDPSPAEKQNEGDPSVLTAVSLDEDGAYYVREIRRGWWQLHDVVANIIQMWRIYRPYQVGVESVACQKWLGQELDRVKGTERAYFETVLIKRDPKLKKWERLKKILFPLRAERIHLRLSDKDEPAVKALYQEMRGYPRGRHDDILDTLADAVECLKPPPKVKAEPLEVFRHPKTILEGSNPFQTGYSFRRRSYPALRRLRQ